MHTTGEVVGFSLVTASISFTLAEAKLFGPWREWIARRSTLLGELFACGYCVGHWVALVMVAAFRPRLFEIWWLADYLMTMLAIAWLAAFQWATLCVLLEKVGK